MLTIPIYLLSVFRAPVYFLNQVKRVVTRFLWHGETEKGIVWQKWSICCLPKSRGGLGLRDLGCLNQALLAKMAWRIFKNPDSLLSSFLRGKYCSHTDFLDAKAASNASWGWRSILWGKKLLKEGLRWRVGSGNKMDVFKEEWIPKSFNPYVGTW